MLLLICTSAYMHDMMPSLLDKRKDTVPMSFFWKFARMGERLSPYVSLCCVAMAVSISCLPFDRFGWGLEVDVREVCQEGLELTSRRCI